MGGKSIKHGKVCDPFSDFIILIDSTRKTNLLNLNIL